MARFPLMACGLLLAWCLHCLPGLAGQGPLAGDDPDGALDRVECHDGSVHVGRVLRPFDPAGLVLLDGGRRTHGSCFRIDATVANGSGLWAQSS